MQVNLILRKQVELSALQIKDSKTRRLFILADGERTLEQLYELCGFNQDQGAAIVKVLVDEGCVEIANNAVPAPGEGIVLTSSFVEKLTAEMANYVGPIAVILVQNNAKPGQVLTKEALRDILTALAENIEGEMDKQQFFKNMNGVLETY